MKTKANAMSEAQKAAQSLLQRLSVPGLGGATDDSRLIRPGDLFLAYPGETGDGRRHILDALSRGAKAVLWEEEDFAWQAEWKTPNLAVRNLRALVGEIAHELAGFPGKKLSLIAITGTNGKTSISQWLASAYPKPCAAIGTLGAGFSGALVSTGFTTPRAAMLARLLADFVGEGARACALEASSIGMAEGRLDALDIDIAIFTNFTRDHLDYHGSMEAYAAAKEQLFCAMQPRLAIINLDDPLGERLMEKSRAGKTVGYSLAGKSAAIEARAIASTTSGQVFRLVTPEGEALVETALLGCYNIANMLAVAAVLVDVGLAPGEIAARLSKLSPPPGRMERYGGEDTPCIAVDYAHTPDALENALLALRPLAKARQGRLFCLFGCAGGRDVGKRPQMGKVAAAGADKAWLTSDNPRFEEPELILRDIREGIAADVFDTRCHLEPDREAAIMHMLAAAEPEDVCLVAGKGHESWQEIAGSYYEFRDGAKVEQGLMQWKATRPWHTHWRSGQMHWALADIAPRLQADLRGEDCVIHGVTIDSRADCRGRLFIALQGERFDAHDYLSDAVQAGAVALMVERPEKLPQGVPALVVADCRRALGALAQCWRQFFRLPLIGLTGSNGKTTTREMIAGILEDAFGEDKVLATAGNLNNEVGLPLTLLRLRPSHRAAVIEMGMNHPGEIARLAQIACPGIVLVTNAGHAHLEGMGNLTGVAAEKGSIYAGLAADGIALINGDDAYAELWRGMAAGRRSMTFGIAPDCDFAGEAEQQGLQTRLLVKKGLGEPLEVILAVPGAHNARNALAALAAASSALSALSLDGKTIAAHVKRGLEAFTGVAGRLQVMRLNNGAILLDDTYNANPDSVRAGIDVLAAAIGKKILVLGDMGEIGVAGHQYHDEIGGYAKSMGIDRLYTLGELSRQAARNFGAGAASHNSPETLVSALQKELTADTTVLIKGSRFMRMERVVAILPVTGKEK
ncbi:MAG: UDP-N-acetylmuramoyl-L-alanyl-D-glutamate--2,6-diaminopimelate ligase [Betaproteobacteria bacterium]|nr:UDP-N-acetylmuramoyl-L-alanyl-D-glutamate--2,6-diaminopimelate ligase [Betaproteobacteria bacterium]